MNRWQIIISLIVTLAVVGSIYVGLIYVEDHSDDSAEGVLVRVRPGTTLKRIQTELDEKGILKHPALFRWAAFVLRREKSVRVGEYLFRPGESVASILDKLTGGRVEYRKIVIPEGLMAREIASIVQREAGIDSVAFETAIRDSALIAGAGLYVERLEGYLFPDTYLVSWPYSAGDIVGQMLDRFGAVYSEVAGGNTPAGGLSRHGVVTLASIIQAEAAVEAEMPMISAVYHNRLDRGMRLEADPTVAYALGGVRRKLWYKDLRTDSPYNTYIYGGLPPGPICSPGRAALAAAAEPLKGYDALYFVADGTGRHIFSRTLVEHNRAKQEIKDGGAGGR